MNSIVERGGTLTHADGDWSHWICFSVRRHAHFSVGVGVHDDGYMIVG